MSISNLHCVTCDMCQYQGTWCRTIPLARADAKRNGWQKWRNPNDKRMSSKLKDVCPDCAKRLQAVQP